MAEDLVLDTAIRDWVLIPLSVVMVLIGILRYLVSKLMRSSPSPDAKMVKEGSVFTQLSWRWWWSLFCLLIRRFCFYFFVVSSQVIIRARNLKAAANFIPLRSFRTRRLYFSNEVCFKVLVFLDSLELWRSLFYSTI